MAVATAVNLSTLLVTLEPGWLPIIKQRFALSKYENTHPNVLGKNLVTTMIEHPAVKIHDRSQNDNPALKSLYVVLEKSVANKHARTG
jgi:hypothetical protein